MDHHNPVKEKLCREINKRCEEKLNKKVSKKPKVLKSSRNSKNLPAKTTFQYNYYVSTWDRLIARTQTNDQYFKKGEYMRSTERDRQDRYLSKLLTYLAIPEEQ